MPEEGPIEDEPLEKAIPGQERDIDAWAEARDKKGEDRQWGYRRLPGRPPKGATKEVIKSTTWIDSLMKQGFSSPIIKEVKDNGRQLWFFSDGIDYVGDVLANGNIFVEKAKFAPMQTNKKRLERENVQGEPYTGDVIEDSEDV